MRTEGWAPRDAPALWSLCVASSWSRVLGILAFPRVRGPGGTEPRLPGSWGRRTSGSSNKASKPGPQISATIQASQNCLQVHRPGDHPATRDGGEQGSQGPCPPPAPPPRHLLEEGVAGRRPWEDPASRLKDTPVGAGDPVCVKVRV